jgi:hypothetical protein
MKWDLILWADKFVGGIVEKYSLHSFYLAVRIGFIRWIKFFPILILELHIHDVRSGMWCAVSATRVNGPIFLTPSIYSDVVYYMLTPMSEYLSNYEKTPFQ